MIRSLRFSSLLAIAAMAVASFDHYAGRLRESVVHAVVQVYRTVRKWAFDFVVTPLRALAQRFTPWMLALPGVKLLAAKLYVLRQVRRQSPVTSPTWRMCPSG